MAKGEVRYPNDVWDRLQHEHDKLAAWGWLERTRRYSDNAATKSVRQVAGRFRRSRSWAKSIYDFWQESRRTTDAADNIGNSYVAGATKDVEIPMSHKRATKEPGRSRGETSDPVVVKGEIEDIKTVEEPGRSRGETKKEPHTKKQEAINKKQLKTTTDIFTLSDGIPTDLWESWMKIRSKKGGADTPRAKTALVKRLHESVEAGYDITETMETIVVKKWTGFEVEWLKNNTRRSTTFRQQEEEADAERIRRRNERLATSQAFAQDASELSRVVLPEDSGGD